MVGLFVNRSGIALNFVSDKRSFDVLKQIEAFYGKQVQRFPSEDLAQLDTMLREVS